MEEHLERLYESAKMRGWKLHVKPSEIAEAVSKTVKKNNFKESRVRITITPGVKQPTVFIWCQPLLALPKKFIRAEFPLSLFRSNDRFRK